MINADCSTNVGLGDGAKCVEHVEADFMAKPEELAEMMKSKIKKVYVTL